MERHNVLGPILAALVCLSVGAQETRNFKKSLKIFHVDLRWETPKKSAHQHLSTEIPKLSERLKIALDPDCRWRKKRANGCKNAFETQTQKVERLARSIQKETLGYFNIAEKHKDGATKRDFDGLSQGYFIERLKKKLPNPWLVDFAGDLFFSGGFVPESRFTILDPESDLFTYATVSLNRGWMIAATSPRLGAHIRGKKSNPKRVSSDFIRIVLFASPKFNGARLDAWSTALISGGKPLLKHLWSLERFRDQWAYLYFTPGYFNGNTPVCSPHPEMDCQLNRPSRTVALPQWDNMDG